MRGTNSTCQKGRTFKHGIFRACEFFSKLYDTCQWHVPRVIPWASIYRQKHVPIACLCRTSSVRSKSDQRFGCNDLIRQITCNVTRGTWHTNHIAIDLIILLSFQAEQSLSGPNPLSRSSTRSKRVKTRATCQCHVAHSTEKDAIDLAIFRSLNWVEWHLPASDRASRSDAMNEFIILLGTCLCYVPRGRHHRFPNELCPPIAAIGPHSFSPICPLIWPATLSTTFFQGLAHCHVAPIALRLAPASFHRSSASNGVSPVPIGPAVFAPGAQMLGQTDTHTHTHTHTQTNSIEPTFFSDPPGEISEHNNSTLNHWSHYIVRFWTRGRHCFMHWLLSNS